MHMKRLNKEVEQFFNDHYKEHEELKAEIEKWVSKTDKELTNLNQKSSSFEKDFENRFERVNQWLGKKQVELERKFNE
ncbi:hypothetical protein [Litchfieldia salsa]|uniref:Uncharacterized protein n=1 Tax=Litchfieldia salsa TaxID=930152 RepID=A0A1H0S2Y2_9BACI|nr:hypothetical protein [Litchfieldia salsa]SDP35949.1 hypothetical protein SAMN05216565_102511 [Litchfieldia salsa]